MTKAIGTLLLLSACSNLFDSDGDGLSNTEEQELGTDNGDADSDADGLSDFLEVRELKTDPLNADTDGDGANDGHEDQLCLDPNDAGSHPYALGWPMVSCGQKDALMNGVSPPIVEVGKRMRRAFVYDKSAEIFDIYDLAGMPTIVAYYSTDEDGDRHDRMTRWLDAVPDDRPVEYFPPQWIRDGALNGDIHLAFITKNIDDNLDYPELPTIDALADFCTFDMFGCFADVSQELRPYAGETEGRDTGSSWFLLDENMIVRSFVLDAEGTLDAFVDMEEKLAIMLNITTP
jgi:hypothetical protein